MLTSTDGVTWTERAKATKLPAVSTLHEAPEALPIFATNFEADDVASARLYVTGLGVYNASINGEPVSEDLLEPANTFHAKRVPYATYDVTSLLDEGDNSLGLEVGNGIFNVFNVPSAPTRYVKTASGHGAPRVMGQLEITDKSGKVTTVATDAGAESSWRTTLGEVTFTSWYGGEDVDARRHIDGWDEAGTDRSSWTTPVASQAPRQTTRLVGRVQPPIRQVDDLDTTWTQLPNGDYLFDFGVNFAGWQQLNVTGPAGTAITMRPGERLNRDGDGNPTGVNQDSSGKNAYDTFTLAGEGTETYTPRFRYHGMRWLQVSGLPTAPTADTMKGLVLRTSNEAVGEFTTSDETLGKIHTMIDRSVQSNMYSVLTDCPHREKLGWLDQTNLNFDTVARGYDMQAQYRKMLQDAADSQTANGLIPTTAPEDSLFAGAFRHDANWGATMSVSAWQVYEEYGDLDPMRTYWPNMVSYDQYLRLHRERLHPAGRPERLGHAGGVGQPGARRLRPDLRLAQDRAHHGRHRDHPREVRPGADLRAEGRPDRRGVPHDLLRRRQVEQRQPGRPGARARRGPGAGRPAARRGAGPARPDRERRRTVRWSARSASTPCCASSPRRVSTTWSTPSPPGPPATGYAKFLGQGATSLPEHWSGMGSSALAEPLHAGHARGLAEQQPRGPRTRRPARSPGSTSSSSRPSSTGWTARARRTTPVRGPIATSWKRTAGELTLDVTVPGNTVATVRVPNPADGSAVCGPRARRSCRARSRASPSSRSAPAPTPSGPAARRRRTPPGWRSPPPPSRTAPAARSWST